MRRVTTPHSAAAPASRRPLSGSREPWSARAGSAVGICSRNATLFGGQTEREACRGDRRVGDCGQPRDIAGAIAYLAASEAGHISGAALNVDDGAQP
jgi:NAD(P)-dependent dehydrogenase (short-subunit alcohol dehydrogenase family)